MPRVAEVGDKVKCRIKSEKMPSIINQRVKGNLKN